MLKINSRDNQKLKLARKVRDGRVKNLIFIEGLRLAEEALRSNVPVVDIFVGEDFSKSERGRSFLQKFKVFNQFEVSQHIFNSLSDTKHPPGLILIAKKPETGKNIIEKRLENKAQRFPLLLLLHRINNPSNLGAILRTGEAVDVAGVILTKDSADVFSPKALRGAMGASFRLPIWNNAEYFEVLDWAQRIDFVSVCADVNSKKSYAEINWKKRRLLIFGSEAHGLNTAEREKVEESLIIPMENDVESLNLAVACGVILFEARRQTDN